ncbi:MAG: GAF domain-containing protein [Chloroflexi bacterium]|nr:GAF domain-containing protein [Chloroflexota bacterium]
MSTNAVNTLTTHSRQAQKAFRTSLVLAVAASATLPVYLVLALRANAWQIYISLFSLLGFAAAAWVSVRLCRQGDVTRGIALIIYANVAAAFTVSVVVAGIGLALGAATFVVILQISTQHLPSQISFRPILVVAVVAIVMGLMDFLAFPFQYVIPSLQNITFTIAGVILVVYAILVIRQFSTLPLRNKLLLSFLLVAFLSVSLVAGFAVQRSRTALIESANQSLLAAAIQTALSLDTFIDNNLNAVRIEAGFPDFVSYLQLPTAQRPNSAEETRVRRLLLQLSRKNPDYILSYALLDINGIHVVDTFFPEQNLDAASLSYFLEPLHTGVPYVSSIEQSLTEGGASLYFSAPVRNSSGDPIGVLRVSFNAGVIQQMIHQNTDLLGETSGAILLDNNGIRLADGFNSNLIMQSVVPLEPDLVAALQAQRLLPNRPLDTLATDFPSFAEGLANAETTPVFDAEIHPDEDHLDTIAVAPLTLRPWKVAFAISQPTYLAPIQAQTREIIIISLLIALFVAISAIFVAELLTAPIVRLTTVAGKVAGGDLQVQALVETEDEIGTLATTFNTMTAQVSELVEMLEHRVQERTQALEMSTNISRRLSTILDPQQLVVEVVEQLKTSFHYYHAHIYLLDELREHLVLAGGTGDVGRQLLTQRHSIRMGQGLVGRTAAINSPILIPDVTQEPGWLPNPLLPETKAEIAVPISVGSQVLGVLDVQNNLVNSLGLADVDLIQSIGNQMGIAIQNARLYAQAQQQAEKAAFINDVGQKIQSATTIDRVLQIAAQELGQTLGTRRTTVQIGIRSGQPNGKAKSETP